MTSPGLELGKMTKHAERCLRKYQRWNMISLTVSIVAGTLATALAGGVGMKGDAVTHHFGGGPSTCRIIAGLSALATISTALPKSLAISDTVAQAQQALASLLILQLMKQPQEKIATALSEIIRSHPRVFT